LRVGLGYPGAYPQVISVASAGWVGEWRACTDTPLGADFNFWWVGCDVPEPVAQDASAFYISDFSSRAKNDQDLDVAAPGSWVLGPYQLNSG
jgi:hypothetical protein